MKISRQAIYLLIMVFTLLIGVLLFTLFVLVPQGKDYRTLRLEKRKYSSELAQYQQWHDEMYDELKTLQHDNHLILQNFTNTFDAKRFTEKYSAMFHSLQLSAIKQASDQNYTTYEVNATTQIETPKTFYAFIDSLGKSDWIIAVNFPIQFKEEAGLLHTSFTMRVYSALN